VQAAAVIVRSGANHAQQLEAYVVLRDDAQDTEDELRDGLRRRLPSYMVPPVLVQLAAMPLSGNGKVDRAALHPPAIRAATERPAIGLRTAYELLVAEVWSQVLDIMATSADDDFFVCGGDSIRAIQVVQKLRRRLPAAKLTVAELYAAPRIGDLAALLQRGVANATPAVELAGEAAPPLDVFDEITRLPASVATRLAADYEDVYPANHVQELIVREYPKAPLGAGVYHLQQMLEIGLPEHEIATFRQALATVVSRVRALRSVFLIGVSEHPLVAVRRAAETVIPEDDLRALSPEAQSARLDAMFVEDRNQPFDVGDAETPLMRFRLLRRADTEFTLFFSAHHALWDGWSNAEFYSQVHAEHGRILAGLSDPRPAPVDTAREFVAWERRKLVADGAATRQYWAEHLAGAPVRASGERSGAHPAWHAPVMLALTPPELAALEQVARDLRITVKALLMRAFLDVFAPVPDGGTPGDRIVGVVANRRSDELTDPWSAMGLFWNIVPFRFALTGNPRSDALAVHSQLLEAEAHVWYPPRDPAAELRRTEPYQVLFNFINLHNLRTNEGSSLEFRSLRAYDRYHLPLNSLFAVTPGTRGLSLRLEFDPRWYDAADVAARGEQLMTELRSFAGVAAGKPARSERDPAQISMRAERATSPAQREREEATKK
jgi:aryl carrier-like protein